MNEKMDDIGTARTRIQLIKSLKIAIKEADKLNAILDEIHDSLHANAEKKAA